jgi:hypothetical protein
LLAALAVAVTALPAPAAGKKVTLESLLRQMTDLSLLAEYPDPPYVTKQFSSYERRSESPKDADGWFANHDRGFPLYSGVVARKTPYYKAGPKQGKAPDGHFAPGTKVGIAPNRKPIGDYVWAYTTAADGTPINGKIPQGYILKSAITLDPQGHVLAEMDGPGCVVRIWSANPGDAGTIRIYVDGAKKPVIEAPMKDLLSGKWQTETGGKKWTPFPDPIAHERSRGVNLYFPIAYAKHCKIAVDKPDIYYHVDYRTYPEETEVESFSFRQLQGIWGERSFIGGTRKGLILKQLRGEALERTFNVGGETKKARTNQSNLGPSTRAPVLTLKGPGVVCSLTAHIGKYKYDEEALRGLLLTGSFDGAAKAQIWCPLGDFFGSAPGANPSKSLPFSVRNRQKAKGKVEFGAFWMMPFEKSAVFKVQNLGKQPVSVEIEVEYHPYRWTDRSMHFHAKWRTDTMKTRPFRDYTYCDLRGKGVYVGNMLSILNPVTAWWGEGDEKIYVDGEKFPSWFGTGTEDYYGYAWSDPKPFQHAYHNQTRCDGPGTKGWTSVNRFHILDAIPFTKSFRFDMEVWHWTPNVNVTYATINYWYARPGARDDFKPVAAGALQKIPSLPPPYKIKGAIEGEKMKVLKKSGNFDAGPQDMSEFTEGKWSGDSHLWVRPPKKGAWVDLELPVAADGKYHVVVYLTRARDYGIVQFHLNGKPLDKPIDGFHPSKVVSTGAIDLGEVELKKGKAVLRVEVVGTNEKSVGLRYMWGLDCVVLKPAGKP